jgi:hypothetical protein
MPLTLPGLLNRFFTSAANLFQSSRITGESFPSYLVFGDGRVYLSDGTEDLTSGSLVYRLPEMYVRARSGRIALVLRGNADTAQEEAILEIQDHFGAPIFALGDTGGVYLNDNLTVDFSPNGPKNLFADIYGHLQLGAQSALRFSAGPPGNMLTFVDACGEMFQRGRAPLQGSWTAANAAYSANDCGAGLAPTGLRYTRKWTSAAAGNIVSITGTGTAGLPATAGVFYAATTKTASATLTRSKQLALVFYNAAGTQIGSAFPGTAVTDTTTGWTTLLAQAVAPSGTATMAQQLTVTGTAAAGEIHFDACAGIWSGLTSSQVTAWNPPFVYRVDLAMPGPWNTVTGTTGNGVSPIVITTGAGHPFKVGDVVSVTGIVGNTAANQAFVIISSVSSTTITIPGTGNGAWASGGAVTMNDSGDGRYDGANAGDVIVRSDGPANVVQRFWTNAASGIPSAQNWVSDPRLTSSPARLNWYGGNYLQQGVAGDPDYILPSVALGMLHNDPPDSVNRGVITTAGAWNLLNDAANAQAFGGFAGFLQAVRKKATGAPYVSKDGMFALFYGLWDMQAVTVGGGAGQMTQINGSTTGAVAHTLRDMIAHARASNILPYTDTHFSLSGNNISGAGQQYAFSGGGPGQGGTFAYWTTTTSASFTFTVPADFTGGAVGISLLGAAGVFGGQVTWTGTLFTTGGVANPGVLSTSNIAPAGARARICVRFKNLTSAHAGLTIIGTITALDAGGNVALDCAYIEGQYPNMVAVLGAPKLVTNAAYATLAGAGTYWNGNSGSTGAADVAQLNTALQALVAEFDPSVFYVDTDAAIQSQASFFAADGCTLGAFGVHAIASAFVYALQAQLPLVNFRNVNHDYHDTSVAPVGAPFSKQGPLALTTGVSRFYADDYYYLSGARASVNTAPTGGPVVIDVLKNGSTIFTTPANRPSITAGTTTAVSAAPPDLLFVVPGDYLTVNVAQVGTTFPGADLTVNVLGRKIPIP